MEFSIKSGHPEKQRTACVVAGVYEPRRLSEIAKQIDDVSDGRLSTLLRRGDLEGKLGQTFPHPANPLPPVPNTSRA